MTPDDLMFAVGIAVAVFLLLGSVGGYLVYELRFSPRARVRKRIATVVNPGAAMASRGSVVGDGSRRKHVQAKLKALEHEERAKSRRRNQLRQMMLESGLQFSMGRYYLICSVVALAAAGGYLAAGFWPWGAILVAPPVGFFVPRWVLSYLAKRRKQQFTSQFADAVDVIVRGVKSGLPIGECLKIIAQESPEPMAGEFLMITEAQRLGLTIDEAVGRALERMPTPELKFFAIVMNIQQQTGGNLAETLSNLSTVLRDRKKMRDKIKAVSSEARWTAIIIGSLPFLVCGVLALTNPDYVMLLFTDSWGHIFVGFSLVWMTTGALIMKKMVNFEI
jgi:tight adherence protein B